MTQPTSPLIVALDVPTFEKMQSIVDAIGEQVSTYKIGHQLLTAEGPKTIRYLKARGKAVFLDLKLHEIPNSVAQAVASAERHGVDMLTVHASGGRLMMETAVQASTHFPGMKIIALTVVTGLTDQDLHAIGIPDTCDTQVERLARLAEQAGCHGVIASPKELALLRPLLSPSTLIITPGVRPSWASPNDQSRVSTPAEAMRAGASYIIIGRPIVASADPATAVENILANINFNPTD